MSERVLRSRKRKAVPVEEEDVTPKKAVAGRAKREKKPAAAVSKPTEKATKNKKKQAVKKAASNDANGDDEVVLSDITKENKPKKNNSKATKKEADKTTKKPTKAKAKAAPKKAGKEPSAKSDAGDGDKIEMKKVQFQGVVPVDDQCTAPKGDYEVYINGHNIYNAMLNQTNIGNNNNKYYLLQMLKAKKGSDFMVWFRWGRVGKTAGTKLEPCSTFEEALKTFEKKFKDKTKNDWMYRDQFEHFPGKYDLIEMDYGANTDERSTADAEKVKVSDSTLAVEIQALIELIFNVKEFDATVKEMKFDPRRSPLGKLTEAQIQTGYEILSKIENLIKTSSSSKDLSEACNVFYSRIPHNFGMKRPPVIHTLKEVEEKIQLLEALGDIKIAMKMIEDSMGVDGRNPIDSQYLSLKCELTPVVRGSPDFSMIEKYVHNTHASTHTHYTLQIGNIFRVQKDQPGYRSNLPNRYLLWHGSRLSNWCGILKQGLRIAPPEAPSTGYMFGKGIYFADMVSKSANYCYTNQRQPSGLLLLCEVALGTWQEKRQCDYEAHRLAPGIHSTKGIGRTQPDPSQNFTTDDGVVVPFGKASNVAGSQNTALLYNEYIVYDVNQVKPCYLVQVDFKFGTSSWW